MKRVLVLRGMALSAAIAAAPVACSLGVSGISGSSSASSASAGPGSSAGSGGAAAGSSSSTSGAGPATSGSTSTSGSTASSASSSSGAGGAMNDPCGAEGTSGFQDDFDDNMISPQWFHWADMGASTNETNQTVVITSNGMPPNAGGYDWKAMGKDARSLIGCHAFIEVKQVLSTTAQGEVWFALKNDQGDEVSFNQIGNQLRFIYNPANGGPMQTDLPYDGTAHRWWKLHESGGNVMWETSPDGKQWVVRRTMKTPSFVNKVWLSFGAVSVGQVPGGGTAILDNLNTPPP